MKKQLLIYNDQGVSQHQIPKIEKLFAHINISVRKVDADYLKHKFLNPQTDILCIPGGRDIPYQRKLMPLGVENIKKFVESGGKYLGICAGAYFASSSVEFEKGGKLEVIAKRNLEFYPSIAVGPILGLGAFDYYSENGVLWPDIHFVKDEKKIPMYYNGGCGFLDEHPDVEVIAYYPSRIPAIICCKVGSGTAILSGVHPEYLEDAELNAYLFELFINHFKIEF